MGFVDQVAAARLTAGTVAAAIGAPVRRQNVEHWLRNGRVPTEHCPALEAAFGWTCEALRPDARWVRIPDPDWPWHPAGRPLLDLTRAATPQPQPAAQPAAANA